MDKLDGRRLKVLFLASWYPSLEHPISGIFIKRHALAVSQYCDVAAIYVNLGKVENDVKVTKEDGIIEVRIYRKMPEYRDKLMAKIHKYILIYIEYLLAGLAGYKIIEKEFGRPDLVHVNVIFYMGLVGLALKLMKGLPYLVTEHWAGYFKEDGGFEGRTLFGKNLIRAIGNHASAIITVSGRLRDAMKACGIENKFFVVPNVVDMGDYSKNSNCNGDKKRIVHISLLKDPVKNVSGIIEAVNILHRKRNDFELHLIGDGNDRKKLEDLSESLGLLNNTIFFHGMVDADKVAGFLRCADFSIINSNFETFSVSAAESLACGKPVIATRCGGPEEFVNDKCGILVEPKDIEGLAKAIDYMLDNCSRYDSLEISRYAKERFSSGRVGAEIFDIYESILNS